MKEEEKIAVVPETAAELCGVGVEVIRTWAKNDATFPAIAVGRKLIIPVDGLRKWIEQRASLRVGLKNHSSQVAGIIERKRRGKTCAGEF